MAATQPAVRFLQRSTARVRRLLKPVWAGVRFVWDHPLVLNAGLLVLLVLLLSPMLKQTFSAYTNCNYLITQRLSAPAEICEGVDFGLLGRVDGLKKFMDAPLEAGRSLLVWLVIFIFASLSLYLTLLINSLKTIVKLLTFNKAAWAAMMANMRVWLLLFVSFCALFYFNVTR